MRMNGGTLPCQRILNIRCAERLKSFLVPKKWKISKETLRIWQTMSRESFLPIVQKAVLTMKRTVAPEHGGLTRIKRKKVQTVTMRRKNMCPRATMHKITTIIMGQIRAKIQSRYSHTKHSVYPVYCSPFLAELVWVFLPCFCW